MIYGFENVMAANILKAHRFQFILGLVVFYTNLAASIIFSRKKGGENLEVISYFCHFSLVKDILSYPRGGMGEAGDQEENCRGEQD